MKRFRVTNDNPLLRRLSRQTGLAVPKALSQTTSVVSRQIIVVACGIILNILLARLLSKEVYGQYNLVLSVVGIAAVFTLPGLNTVVLQSAAKGDERFYNRALRVSVIGGVVAAVGLLFALGVVPQLFGRGIDPRALMVAALLLPLFSGLNAWDVFLTGKQNFRLSGIYAATQSVVVTVITGLSVWYFQTLLAVILAYVATIAITNALFAYATSRHTTGGDRGAEGVWLGFHLTWTNFLPTISDYLDRILLGLFLGPVKVAEYAIALTITNSVRTNSKTVLNIMTPRIASRDIEETSRVVKKNRGLILLLGVVMAAFVWFVVPIVVPLFFGESYRSIVPIAQWIGLTLILMPLNTTYANLILFDEQLTQNTLLLTIPPLLRMATYPFLLVRYELFGLVVAHLGERLIMYGLGEYFIHRRLRQGRQGRERS